MRSRSVSVPLLAVLTRFPVATGFVMILDSSTIVIPDRPGNNILMGLQNMLENPQVGICFEIPGNTTTLRVGGHATLRTDAELLHRLEARGIDATMAIRVDISYAFFHCAKAYMRSRLWEPASWPEETLQVSFGQCESHKNARSRAAMLDPDDISWHPVASRLRGG